MGTVTLVPNADVSHFGSWTRSSGTTDYNLLSDASDSSYLASVSVNANAVVDFGTTTLPSGAVVKSVSPRVRTNVSSGSGGYIIVSPYTSARGGSDPSYSVTVAPTSTITTYTTTAMTHVPGLSSAAWAQTDIDGLRVILQHASATAASTIRTYELYLDVLYASPPAVSAVTVTNYTSSTPTIAWTYTAGTDGGSQTRYEVKVFDSATYGAGGFSPDTSTAAYEETGYTSATSITVPAGYLASNGTYKSYVRVSQTINAAYQTSTGGVGSGWDLSSAFTIAIDAPAPVTLTVTPDQANNRTALIVQGHDNLMSEQDANMETAASTGNWSALTNCSIAQSTTQAITPGTGSLRLSSTAAGDMEARTATGTSGYPVVAARVYTLRASFRAGATTRSCKVGVRWYDSGGTIIGSASYSSTVSGTSSGFTEATADVTAPALATYASVAVYVVGPTAGSELFYVDHIAMQEQAGNTPAAWYRGGLQGAAPTGVKYYAIEYSDDGGTTWDDVFGATAIADGTNQLAATVDDFAYDPGTTRSYRAFSYYTQSSATTNGATSAGSQTSTLDLDDWRFVDVVEGTQLTLRVISDDPHQRRRPRTVNDILGASYPIVTDDRRKSIEATLTVETISSDEEDDLNTMLDNGNTLLLQGPSAAGGGTRWVRIGDTSSAPLSRVLPYWLTWTLPYVQVNAPAS